MTKITLQVRVKNDNIKQKLIPFVEIEHASEKYDDVTFFAIELSFVILEIRKHPHT